ncbi:MAG TPA: metalloregulator ArsR/SmtB family transcription factor [Anaerolineae bacterium]
MTASLDSTAKLFKILSDPTRLRIIRALTLECQSVSAIVAQTELSQPLVSHHLRVLREYGLTRADLRGGFTYY